MQLKSDQLAGQLKQGLSPVYLIFGEEQLLVEESSDLIRQAARQSGSSERQTWHVEGRFDWSQIQWQEQTLSLFSSQRLVEIRLPSGSPGKEGGEAIRRFCENPAEDTVLLIISGKIDSRSQKSKWFAEVDKLGVTIPIWPIALAQLPAWIGQRMQQKGLKASQTVHSLIAERVEGNLFAAAQEIEKLALLSTEGEVDEQLVLDSVADNARFQAFGLMDAVYARQTDKIPRIIDRLKAEGLEFLSIFSAVSWSVHRMVNMAIQLSRGDSIDRVFAAQKPKIFYKTQPLIKQALQQHTTEQWQGFVAEMAKIDAAAKGANAYCPWSLLEALCLRVAGVKVINR